MRKLRVFRSVGEVFAGVTRHYFQLLFVAWPAVILLLAGTAAFYWLLFQAGLYGMAGVERAVGSPEEVLERYREALAAYSMATIVAVVLAMLLAQAVAAVRWHRFVLLGEGGSVPFRREDLQYVWTTLKILFFWILFLLVLSAVVGVIAVIVIFAGAALFGDGAPSLAALGPAGIVLLPLGVVLNVFMLGVVVRLMLALPDAALGGGQGVLGTFAATSGNTWRISGFALLIYLPVFILLAVVEGIAGLALTSAADLIGSIAAVVSAIISLALYLYLMMTQVTMLSVAYREIVGLPGGHEGEATVAEPTPGL
ncbi:MAG: hypothetical protein WD034_03385 [Parvibaculum sp.]